MDLPKMVILEIFTYANDLEILIKQTKKGDPYSLNIYHGLSKKFRLILLIGPFAQTHEDAVEGVKTILQNIYVTATEDRKDNESFISQALPFCASANETKTLNEDLINQVISAFQGRSVVRTRELVV